MNNLVEQLCIEGVVDFCEQPCRTTLFNIIVARLQVGAYYENSGENMQYWQIAVGILIPFIGTSVGAVTAAFTKNGLKPSVERFLLGFASGVMLAASVWSLLLPAINSSAHMDAFAFVPAAVGFALGMAFLLAIDKLVPHIYEKSPPEKRSNHMLTLAVTIHNIPEGLAVGVAFAGLLVNDSAVTLTGAMALSIGIAIQNFPEGAIVSLPSRCIGCSRLRSVMYGVLSGVVEPLFALLAIALLSFIVPALPYLLSFAAGAMVYVVAEELIPRGKEGAESCLCTVGVGLGFLIMMILDVALG